VLDEVGEGLVEVARGLFEDAEGDFDVCTAETGYAFAADLRVGVLCGDDAAGDSRGDESVGAGGCAAVVAAGFEGNVSGGSAGREAAGCGLLESDNLGVVAVVVEVSAFANDFAVEGKHTANLGIG